MNVNRYSRLAIIIIPNIVLAFLFSWVFIGFLKDPEFLSKAL